VSASADDKLKICRRLAKFNVDFIEAGWPGSNPKDAAFFERAKNELNESIREKLVAFGSTRRKKIPVEQDLQVQALLESGAPTVCIVAKSHSWQVEEILRCSRQENLQMIIDTVTHLKNVGGRRLMVDLEHFFDGYKTDPEYAMDCCQAAAQAGAACLVLCDTNGGTMPWEIGEICKAVVERFTDVTIGIHCHNDCNCAVSNSLVAAKNGVGLIQGTVNGIGERTGNANLCSIVPALALHVQSRLTCREQLSELTQLSRFVDEILNRTPDAAAPFVGASAFAHKGGLHVAAMERSPLSYQHIDPELVGNEKRILISELSGRQNILGKMQEVGIEMDADQRSERATAILNHVKELESQGYTFEGAEASVHLMILHATTGYCPPFQVLDYQVNVFDSHIDSASRVLARDPNSAVARLYDKPASARATIKVRTVRQPHEGDSENTVPYVDTLEACDGNGPVHALAHALVKALLPSYPSLESIELVDYKVRILDPENATGAKTRVMIEFTDKAKENLRWTTVSVDTNVISASVNAVIDGLEFALIEHSHGCLLCDDFFD
jgi:2-isopropylmalate synthase